jgi:RNA polymerase sigma-70 factor (ECF subfamily)
MEEKLDNKAFDAIVGEYGKAIFNAAFRIVNDYEDAMDITQNTFIKVYERLDRYDPSRNIFNWLYKIAVNEAISVARRKTRATELDEKTCVQFKNPETEYIQNETSAHIQRALMQLSLDYRTVLILRHFQGLSYEAIGGILGIPVKTVKSRLFTGRMLLRDSLVAMGYTP